MSQFQSLALPGYRPSDTDNCTKGNHNSTRHWLDKRRVWTKEYKSRQSKEARRVVVAKGLRSSTCFDRGHLHKSIFLCDDASPEIHAWVRITRYNDVDRKKGNQQIVGLCVRYIVIDTKLFISWVNSVRNEWVVKTSKNPQEKTLSEESATWKDAGTDHFYSNCKSIQRCASGLENGLLHCVLTCFRHRSSGWIDIYIWHKWNLHAQREVEENKRR